MQNKLAASQGGGGICLSSTRNIPNNNIGYFNKLFDLSSRGHPWISMISDTKFQNSVPMRIAQPEDINFDFFIFVSWAFMLCGRIFRMVTSE